MLIKILFFALVCSFCFPVAGLAESNEASPTDEAQEETAELEPVTVQGQRQKSENTTVESLGADLLMQSGAQTAAQALDLSVATSVGVNARGERKFTLRGFDQRQVLIMIDGLPISAPYSGVTDIDRVPAEVLERIEIIKGADSLGYGTQGLGGAINLITRKPGKGPRLLVRYEFEPVSANRFGLATSGQAGKATWLLAAGFAQSTGFRLSSDFRPTINEDGGTRENSDRFDWHLIGKVGYLLNQEHRLEVGLSFFQGEAGVPPNTTTTTPRYWRWPLWRDLNVYVTHTGLWTSDLKIDETLYVLLLINTLNSFDDGTYRTQITAKSFKSTYQDQIAGGRVRIRLRLPSGTLRSLSLRMLAATRYERHKGTEESEDAQPALDQIHAQLAPELRIGWNRIVETRAAFHVELNKPLQLGENADEKMLWGWGPTIMLRVKPHRIVAINASASRQVRFPTLSERFGSAAGQRQANPSLEPESAWNMALDLTIWPHERLILRIGGFDSEVSGLLNETSLGGGQSQIVNTGDVRLTGAEVEFEALLDYSITLGLSYGFLKYWLLDSIEEPYLDYRPEHKATLRVYAQPLKWIGLGTDFTIVGPQYYQSDDSGRWGILSTYMDWGARFDVFPSLSSRIWFRASNILDLNYHPHQGQPAPGRKFLVGVQLELD
jgi:iron complex outermembrane receptor protein